jgi:hypothetical protein
LLAEQRAAQALLELLDAGGDVGLHPAQLAGRADDAALLHHGAEDLQRVEVECSHGENGPPEKFICGAIPFSV